LVLRDRKRKVLGAPQERNDGLVVNSRPYVRGVGKIDRDLSLEASEVSGVKASFIHLHTHVNSQIEDMT
jgi:hypothetical protein